MKLEALTFKGGVLVDGHKELSNQSPLIVAEAPANSDNRYASILGAPCEPIVKVGDEVRVGQKIGEAKAYVSTPVHSSVSGKVKRSRTLQPLTVELVKPLLLRTTDWIRLAMR